MSGVRGIAVVLLMTSAVAAQQERPHFSARVDLVRVDVLATHRGRPIAGLGAGAFRLLDNGVPQTIDSVEIERVPLSVILAFDVSGSMAGEPLQHLAEAGVRLVNALEEHDRAALLTFSDELILATPLTGDREVVRRGLARLSARGSTSLFDAIYSGLTLRDADLDRTVLLVFSDGLDTTSWLTGPDVLARARMSDVVVYGVTLADRRAIRTGLAWHPPQGGRSPLARQHQAQSSQAFMESLASETGGQVLSVSSSGDLPRVFSGILEELKSRYVLSYYPQGVSREGWHEIDVTLRDRPGTITSRRGYYAGP